VSGIGCFSRFRATSLSFAKRKKKNHVTIECVQQNCQRQLFENVPGFPHFGLALEQTLKKSLNLSRALGMEKNMIPQHVGAMVDMQQ
jgi:hypothetical protein